MYIQKGRTIVMDTVDNIKNILAHDPQKNYSLGSFDIIEGRR